MRSFPYGWLQTHWCRWFHDTHEEDIEHGGYVVKCATCHKWHIVKH